jgi:Putative polyhydroxyalkanoic acid system protein (PHA_gran_rgn)
VATKPFIAVIPHQLGRQAARQRIEGGLALIRSEVGVFATIVEDSWTDDRLLFRLRLLGQQLTGRIEVFEENVRVEVDLPWMLSALSGAIGTRVREVATLMLTKS